MQVKRIALLIVLSILFCNCTPLAATTDDLYHLYDVKPEHTISEDVMNVLNSAYKTQRKAVSMKHFENIVIKSKEVLKAEECMNEVSQNLIASYDKSYDEIISLEEEYEKAKQNYLRLKSTLNNDFKLNEISINAPSKEAYREAYALFDAYKSKKELGALSGNTVVNSASVTQYPDCTQFSVKTMSPIYSLYNGVVIESERMRVTISTVDNVLVRYQGVLFSDVEVGDVVKQGQVIGKFNNNLSVGISLNNKHCNLAKVLKE